MENLKNSNEIARIILNQLKGIDKMALMSWGSKKFQVVENGLRFQVNTPKISNGWVEIILNKSEDLYNINIYNNRLKKLSESKGVFFDELIYKIDSNIENKEYLNQVYK